MSEKKQALHVSKSKVARLYSEAFTIAMLGAETVALRVNAMQSALSESIEADIAEQVAADIAGAKTPAA